MARLSALAWFRHGRPAGRLAALAGVIAILLQTALAVAHLRLADASGGAAAADVAGVVLCLADARTTEKPAPSTPQHGLPDCVLCQAGHHTALALPPAPSTLVLPPRGASAAAPALRHVEPGHRTILGNQPRAPPAAV